MDVRKRKKALRNRGPQRWFKVRKRAVTGQGILESLIFTIIVHTNTSAFVTLFLPFFITFAWRCLPSLCPIISFFCHNMKILRVPQNLSKAEA